MLLAMTAAAGVYIEATRPRGEAESRPAASAGRQSSTPVAQAPAAVPASRERLLSGLSRLERAVRAGASEAAQPWALAHGLVAFGPELAASDGRPAIEVIASYAEKQSADGGTFFGFPRRKGESVVEPHDDLLTKTLLEVGVPLERRFATAGGSSVTLERLAADLVRRARVPSDDAGWHNAAWTLSALVELERRGAAAAGSLSAAELTRAALSRLELDHGVVQAFEGDPGRAFEKGSPLRRAKEQNSGIYGHGCGGLHLVQAVLSGIPATGDASLVSRARRQLGVLLFRYEAERAAYAKLLADHPEHGLVLRVQQLKFFGHLIETLTLARELRLHDGSTEGGARVERTMLLAASDLLDTLDALERGGVFQRLTEIRREREQTYLDLVGDGCHAIRGLRRLSKED
jgi:hypothetical protein